METKNVLNQALDIISGKRGGYPEDVFVLISKYWGTFLGIDIRPRDVAIMMMLLKIARIHPDLDQWNQDNAVDIAGYAYFADVYSWFKPNEIFDEKSDEL